MNRRGFTIIELMAGLAAAAILAAVIARVFLLGIMAYNFASRQGDSLLSARKAMAGDGSRVGLLTASRGAYQFSLTSSSSLALVGLVGTSTIPVSFALTNGILNYTASTKTVVQASGLTSISLAYYTASAGQISSTTVAAAATMMTATVTVGSGTATAQKPYTLYSGAILRNHP